MKALRICLSIPAHYGLVCYLSGILSHISSLAAWLISSRSFKVHPSVLVYAEPSLVGGRDPRKTSRWIFTGKL